MPGDAQTSPEAAPARRLLPADPWFAVERHPDGILRIWEPHVSRLLRANMFLVRGRDRDLLVDAGMGVASLRRFLDRYAQETVVLVVTHGHADHVGSAAEFDEILVYPAEAGLLENPSPDWTLDFAEYPAALRAQLEAAGFDMGGFAIAATPWPGYDPAEWCITPAAPTGHLDEGDVIDLGDRRLVVLHLPGHTPGSIGLWEEETATLIGGDAIYDGLIIDTLPESDRGAYVGTMRRLLELDARVVHGGHRESFGPEKLTRIAEDYIAANG